MEILSRTILMVVSTFSIWVTATMAEEFKFFDYPATTLNIQTELPSFTGKTKEFEYFRTRISEEMLEGPNFAGHYSVIQLGCGTTCTFVLIGNNKTGDILTIDKGGENTPYLELEYRLDSRLLVTQWGAYGKCEREYYEMRNNEFHSIKKEFPPLNEYGECKNQLN